MATYEEMIAQQMIAEGSADVFRSGSSLADYHALPIEQIQGNPYAGYDPNTGVAVPTVDLRGQDVTSPGYSPVTNLPGGEWASPNYPGGLNQVLGHGSALSGQDEDWLTKKDDSGIDWSMLLMLLLLSKRRR